MSAGVHLFLGADRARKLQRIHEWERALAVAPLDRHHLDGASVGAAPLLALCRQQPAASPLRLIVVDDAHRLEGAAIEALLEHAHVIAKSACVVLLVEAELKARQALARALARGGGLAAEEFPARSAPAAKPFALTEALGRRDAGTALSAARDQLVGGKEPLELLGLVAWQLQRWVVVRRLLDAQVAAERVGELTGLKPWQVERIRAEVARRPLETLDDLLERCWRLDVDAKSGRAIPELALEQLVLEVCAPGG